MSAKGKDLGPEMHEPPRCLIPGWDEAEEWVVITGTGPPARGENMRALLHELANNFSAIAVPESRCTFPTRGNLARVETMPIVRSRNSRRLLWSVSGMSRRPG